MGSRTISKTIKELATDALNVQDACNLSGVVHGFARAMSDLAEHTSGTDERNSHPIVILWVDKLAHLSGYKQDYSATVVDAYKQVSSLAEVRGSRP